MVKVQLGENQAGGVGGIGLPERRVHHHQAVKEENYRNGGGDHECLQPQDKDDVNNHGGHGIEAWKNTSSPANKPNGFFYFLIQALKRQTIFLLFLLAMLVFTTDIEVQGIRYGWHNGVVILIIILMLVIISSVGNCYNERIMSKEKLMKHESKPKVTVVRNGNTLHNLAISDLVVGDTLDLEEGDRVPADGLLIDGGELVSDEIFNSKMDRFRNPNLIAGSKITQGRGRMRVKSTIGANMVMVTDHHQNENDKTLLQCLVDKSDACIDKLTLCVSLVIAMVLLMRLLIFPGLKYKSGSNINHDQLPQEEGKVSMKFVMHLFERFFFKPQRKVSTLVNILVASVIGIRHGNHLVIAGSLSRWRKIWESTNEAYPRKLSACGSMGLVTALVVDANGDQICNKMEVKELWIGGKDISNIDQLDSESSSIDQEALEALRRGIGLPEVLPDLSVSPANDFLISWMKCKLHMNMDFPDTNFRILNARKTRSGASGKQVSRVLMRKIGDDEQYILHLHYKGPASTILEMCSHFYDTKGKKHDMNISSQKGLFERVIEDMENNGLVPFAFACGKTDIEEIKEDVGLDLLAIIGLKYYCRNEIKSQVEALRKAGVIIKLVSDDELPAVKAIAWELGLFSSQSSNINVAMEGQEIREMTESSSRVEKVNQTTVMGNCLPKDKFLMVEDLKKKGHVVAFYGGLTARDAPALTSCDIVITENFRCTEMARELSDISINDMSSLSLIFKYGRCAYHNIQKFFQLQLTALISGLIISFASTIHSGDSPLTALQLIWTNLIIYLLGGFMMVMNLEGDTFHDQPAAKRNRSLVTKVIWKNIAIQVSYQAFLFIIIEFVGHVLPSLGEQGVRKAMIFNTFLLCQIFNHFNVIDMANKEVLKVVFHKHYWSLVALGIVMVTQILIVEVGKDLANCARLNAVQWTLCFLLAAFSCGFDWATKQVLASLQSYNI
ncbi:calcium-transporting ATPase 12, plasma membrane-type [Ziziphus jujuba]|uniref:Calcium-transporting ATPase 12, plasma membrane-type n=1 Tax=Ziziphus jujuba TaxID=326968 RepID=A0A6P4B8U5_ZIZJJ|nr:calcium-transporting ATPase 12, plasma membrane-type [Ziziphus jujuba]